MGEERRKKKEERREKSEERRKKKEESGPDAILILYGVISKTWLELRVHSSWRVWRHRGSPLIEGRRGGSDKHGRLHAHATHTAHTTHAVAQELGTHGIAKPLLLDLGDERASSEHGGSD